MASIVNRSNYIVTVEGKPERTKRFPFHKLKEARQYQRQQQKEHEQDHDNNKKKKDDPEPVQLTQLEDNLLVRIRTKGYPPHNYTANSYEDAEREVLRVTADRAQGKRVDYNKARRITLAWLFQKYMQEECPKHKGCSIERRTLGAFLEDINYAPYLQQRREERTKSGKPERTYRRHEKRKSIEWLLKPFAELEPTDFNRYVEARKKQDIKPSTIDREFDLIAQVINWAIDTLRYQVEVHPMNGFKRPQYFNQRDRRLRGDEGERLIASVREEDRIRSFALAVEEQVQALQQQGPPNPGKKWNKYFLWQARKRIKTKIGKDFLQIPLWEALIEYLLATTSRRGEALSLQWKHTYLEDNEAFYPDTKNGRSRTVPVRQHVVELLKQLPRQTADDRVFPVSADEFEGAWKRICKRAGISDYRIHDNRHQGTSETAEVARAAGRPLDAVSLTALTGHRDLASLARYMHLCGGALAGHIDEAYEIAKRNGSYRKGRVRTRVGERATKSAAANHGSQLQDRECAPDDSPTPERLM